MDLHTGGRADAEFCKLQMQGKQVNIAHFNWLHTIQYPAGSWNGYKQMSDYQLLRTVTGH